MEVINKLLGGTMLLVSGLLLGCALMRIRQPDITVGGNEAIDFVILGVAIILGYLFITVKED